MGKKIRFYKYQGTGNDFILLDNRNKDFDFLNTNDIAGLCYRRFGIGADGLMMLEKDSKTAFKMRYFNADGQESSLCGNGARCIVSFAFHLGICKTGKVLFSAADGVHEAEIVSDLFPQCLVRVQMNQVEKFKKKGNAYILDTGSPHYVCFVPDVDEEDVVKKGRSIRFSKDFPQGINVNFVEIVKELSRFAQPVLRIRTYERGVEDETYSCGTGSVASVLAYFFLMNEEAGLKETDIQTKGGNLRVSFVLEKDEKNKRAKNIFLEGLAKRVFTGEIEI